jgi:hypothetical protein
LFQYEDTKYSGKISCEICSFTVGSGHYWPDVLDAQKHWDTHTWQERGAYFDSLPTLERTGKPLYGWENRLMNMSHDIGRLEDTILALDKRPIEERLAFKMKMKELRSRWMWFEDYADLFLKTEELGQER